MKAKTKNISKTPIKHIHSEEWEKGFMAGKQEELRRKKNYIDAAYIEGFEDGKAEKRVIQEPNNVDEKIWEIAKKIVLPPKDGGLKAEVLVKLFGTTDPQKIFTNFTANQIISIFHNWG